MKKITVEEHLRSPYQHRPNARRESEGHVGVAFGDAYFFVFLDGREVGRYVDEAIAGFPGRVHFLLDPDDPHGDFVDEWVEGNVRIVYKAPRTRLQGFPVDGESTDIFTDK